MESLAAGMTSVFDTPGVERGLPAILSREKNVYTSTFPTEIVTFASDGGTVRRVFCKYGARRVDVVYGHKAGVPYEAKVYEHVLAGVRLPRPEYYGSHVEPRSGR